MRTVKEVSLLTGVSIRTLHYYDSVNLLKPTQITESGYRLYDDTALERLQLILLFRELQFSLNEIKEILESSDFDRNQVLEQQIRLLEMKRSHIQNLITFARGIQVIGVKNMDFSAFDTREMDEYAAQAKATWGKTEAYKEFEEKDKNRSDREKAEIQTALMDIFKQLGVLNTLSPENDEVQGLISTLRQFITENFYVCTPEILQGLGKIYSGGGSMTENIDKVGGRGTADFTAKAIEAYCQNLNR